MVLDEAHSIKDRRCSTARSVFALDARYKWALSGTPLQARDPSRFCKPYQLLTAACRPQSARSSFNQRRSVADQQGYRI